MIQEPETRPNPAWDPAIRRLVQRSLNDLLRTAQDVVTRYRDRDGFYFAPDPVGDVGDVNGLIASGYNQVIRRLQDQLDETRRVIREAYTELDDYQRQQLGDAWKPIRRNI
jgi:hypothetical protein